MFMFMLDRTMVIRLLNELEERGGMWLWPGAEV